MSEIEMIGMFSKKTVLLKILYHSTKPFNDLHFFWFRFPNAFWDPRECEGWVCDLEAVGVTSIFRLIHNDTSLIPSRLFFVYYEEIKRDLNRILIWVSVWWKTKRYNWGIYTPHIHWVSIVCWVFIIRSKERVKENTYRWVSVYRVG